MTNERVEEIRRGYDAQTSCTLGVGRGDGKLLVHGDYESIKAAQAFIFRAEHAEAENERLAKEHRQVTRANGDLAIQLVGMQARTRALEAALVTLMVAPTNHENADTSREYNSVWEAARDTLGFNPFEHRRQAALTEPTPPQEEPR